VTHAAATAVRVEPALEADLDVEAAARSLEGRTPAEILAWAAATIPHVTFATGFGAEGCVVVDLIARAGLAIDLFTLDTGLLFPETVALWRRLETRYGVTIRGVRPAHTLDEQAAALGPALWTRDPDRCCARRKVEPLRRELAGFDAWITAIRRDQTPERATARAVERDRKFDLVKVNPLVGWTHDDVWAYLYAHDVPFNPLHHEGYPSIGCTPCTSAIIPGEHLRAGRWRGAAKRECGLHAETPVLEAPAEERQR
jgi:phosphoadenylyl-sulfate reductase (thioredoxin)